MTILSASSVRTLIHCETQQSRPPDLKPSSKLRLPFAWITGPSTDPSLSIFVGKKVIPQEVFKYSTTFKFLITTLLVETFNESNNLSVFECRDYTFWTLYFWWKLYNPTDTISHIQGGAFYCRANNDSPLTPQFHQRASDMRNWMVVWRRIWIRPSLQFHKFKFQRYKKLKSLGRSLVPRSGGVRGTILYYRAPSNGWIWSGNL